MTLDHIPHHNSCKRGCCWTPHGVCARQHTCSHHVHERAEQDAREARASAVREAANLINIRDSRRTQSWNQ